MKLAPQIESMMKHVARLGRSDFFDFGKRMRLARSVWRDAEPTAQNQFKSLLLNQRLKLFCICLICASLMTACTHLENNDQPTVPFQTLEKSNYSGLQTARQSVITNAAQWRDLWRRHSVTQVEPGEPPSVDFDKNMVIAVAMGRQRTGGYAIEITRVVRVNDTLEVFVKETRPAQGSMLIQTLTSPVHFVQIPRMMLPVKFMPAPTDQNQNE